MQRLPNLLTLTRIGLSAFLFLALVTAGGAAPWPRGAAAPLLERWALAAFIVAAATDFLDGWLARRLGAVTTAGRILDPIADKVLVCAAVLGLMTLAPGRWTAIAFGLILFREFAVSALREVAAGARVVLPVTQLAKWKTALQLAAFGALMVVAEWAALGLGLDAPAWAATGSIALLWIAAVLTLVTGAQYATQAARSLG